jgi:hypothetical protein
MNVPLDTNILGGMMEPGHVQHQLAVDAVATLVGGGDSPCLVPQVLYPPPCPEPVVRFSNEA